MQMGADAVHDFIVAGKTQPVDSKAAQAADSGPAQAGDSAGAPEVDYTSGREGS